MKAKLLLLLVSSFIIRHSAFAQGALTPPGAPAPTMKSLAQIEPRTPISSAPFTISASGSYYLTTNVTTAVSNAIVITASGVTLDLNGFTIASTMANAANGGSAILLGGTASASLSDITIFNGHIRSGVTNNGSGYYNGPGLNFGIIYSVNPPVNVHVYGVSVSGCLSYGIYLNTGDSTVVEGCTARTVGSSGIVASTIKNCVALDCGGSAIYGDQVADSRGESTSYSGGIGLFATTAQNCFGSSNSGEGIYATTAQNCYGVCLGYGTGLEAGRIAIGCYGSSYSGTGLYAFIANACSGSIGTSGTSLSTSHNVNSF